MAKLEKPKATDRKFGLSEREVAMLQSQTNLIDGIRYTQSLYLTQIAVERLGFKENDNLTFQMDLENKSVIVKEVKDEQPGEPTGEETDTKGDSVQTREG